MPNARWLPLVAFALFAAVGLGVLTLWGLGVLRGASGDAKPQIPACDPAVPTGAERPKECPQSAPPTARTP